ncbi:MAG: PilN domain-containing protein [Sedimentisphaerales bacterium]
MGDVNLIPAARLASKHRKAKQRMWMVICGAYLMSLAVASLSARALWGGDDAVVKELTSTVQNIEQYNSAITELRKDLSQATAELLTTRTVKDQPSWGKLLILLSNELGAEVVLSKCQLISSSKKARLSSAKDKKITDHRLAWGGLPERQYRLNLSGFGRTQSSVSRFVLRLERMNIFESVILVDSNRCSFLNGEAVAFSIECRLL